MRPIKKLNLFFLPIWIGILASCSGGSGISEANLISAFISATEQVSSEDNLVKNITETPSLFSVDFENGTSHSIPADLVTYQESSFSIDITFNDGRYSSLKALNSVIQTDVLDQSESSVPLSKKFSVEVPFRGHIHWKTFGRNGEASNITSPTIEVEQGLKTFYVHGLYINSSTQVEIKYTNNQNVDRFTQVFELLPEPIHDALSDLEISSTVFDNDNANRLFLTQHRGSTNPFMIDQFGDIRWTINETVGGRGVQQTDDGGIVAASGLEIIRTSLSGEVKRFEIPAIYGSIHHDIVPMPNPSEYLLTVDSPDGETLEDYLILFDTDSLSVIREWDLKESVPWMRLLIDDDIDWFHVNAIAFDPRDQTILISGQRSAVVKVSWDNDLVWVLTDPARLEGVDVSAINGIGEKSIYEMNLTDFKGDIITWGQHDIRIDFTNNTYYLFDNGLGRFYSNDTKYSRGINFSINADDNRIEILNTYGEDREEFHSPIISGIDFNDQGSVLVNFGSIGYQFDYINSTNWRTPVWKSDYPGFGAAWLEYDNQGGLITEVLFSGPDDDGRDPGIYRARYGSLSH